MAQLQYYVKDAKGNEIYSIDAKGNQQYITSKNHKFAKDVNKKKYYARKVDGDEYYPVIGNEPLGILDAKGVAVYAKTAKGDEIYPVFSGAEMILLNDDGRTFRYARTKTGEEFYPKDENDEEYSRDSILAEDSHGNPKYERDGDGRPKYPYDSILRREEYKLKRVINNVFDPHKTNVIGKKQEIVFGIHSKTHAEVYARRDNGDEYYPHTGQYAFDPKTGEYLYAKKLNGDIIFPKTLQNDEIYVRNREKDYDVIVSDGKPIGRYARRSNKSETYPTMETLHGPLQLVLNRKYAVDSAGNPVYPIDDFGNEYVIPNSGGAAATYPRDYPSTWDQYPIVSAVGGKPLLLSNSKFRVTPLTRKLYRSLNGYSDYISSVKSPNLLLRMGKAYYTKNVSNNLFRWLVLLACVAALLLVAISISTRKLSNLE